MAASAQAVSNKMGKSKRKTHSEVEHLKGVIRSQKSEIRQLKKLLRQKDKYYDDVAENVEEENEDKCPNCGKGEIRIVDFSFVKYEACDICKYKVKV